METQEVLLEKEIDPFKTRFSEAVWFDWLQDRHVMVLGAGGIGSWVTLCLARMGVKLLVSDMDTVEAVNMAGQFYDRASVGLPKTMAVANLCRQFSGVEDIVQVGEFTGTSLIGKIVISAFDNMKARKLAFEKWVGHVKAWQGKGDFLFLDGRLLMENYQVFAVTPDSIEEYRKYLFDDSEVEELPCTMKSTTHCAMGITNEIIGLLTNFAANKALYEELQYDIRNLPFMVEKSIPLYQYITKYGTDNRGYNTESRGFDNQGVLSQDSGV